MKYIVGMTKYVSFSPSRPNDGQRRAKHDVYSVYIEVVGKWGNRQEAIRSFWLVALAGGMGVPPDVDEIMCCKCMCRNTEVRRY